MRIDGWRSESAATAVEYAFLASLIAVVIVVAVLALGQNTRGLIDCTNAAMANTSQQATC